MQSEANKPDENHRAWLLKISVYSPLESPRVLLLTTDDSSLATERFHSWPPENSLLLILDGSAAFVHTAIGVTGADGRIAPPVDQLRASSRHSDDRNPGAERASGKKMKNES
jgi:hypothetical protein